MAGANLIPLPGIIVKIYVKVLFVMLAVTSEFHIGAACLIVPVRAVIAPHKG